MKTMKNLKSTILFCAFALMTSQLTFSQEFKKLDKSPMDVASYPTSYKISDKTVKVTYSRPQLKGRALSKLAPTGEVWRTGANEAAQITFYKPMMAGKTLIKPGTYSLFTIPREKEWTVIINSEINLWGAYYYNQKYDVAMTDPHPRCISMPLYASVKAIEKASVSPLVIVACILATSYF